ncbi:Histidine kinase-, DNA gyrase B-, and HSP90-like ATPase [compost metagenome]
MISIRDDGKGIPPDKLAQLQKDLQAAVAADGREQGLEPIGSSGAGDVGQGYGMLNVQARIALTFGTKYGMTIQSEVGRGTVVTVTHPIIREEPTRWERSES